MKKAVLPGSYDPITVGHLDIIRRTAEMFDEVTVLLAHNASKQYMLNDENRLLLAEDAIKSIPNAKAELYGGMLADYIAEHDFPVIVKGVRGEKDFSYEQDMALYNSELCLRKYGKSAETFLMFSQPVYSSVSSSLVRILYQNGADYRNLLANPDLFNRLMK